MLLIDTGLKTVGVVILCYFPVTYAHGEDSGYCNQIFRTNFQCIWTCDKYLIKENNLCFMLYIIVADVIVDL